jgi:hypothetical protein
MTADSELRVLRWMPGSFGRSVGWSAADIAHILRMGTSTVYRALQQQPAINGSE